MDIYYIFNFEPTLQKYAILFYKTLFDNPEKLDQVLDNFYKHYKSIEDSIEDKDDRSIWGFSKIILKLFINIHEVINKNNILYRKLYKFFKNEKIMISSIEKYLGFKDNQIKDNFTYIKIKNKKQISELSNNPKFDLSIVT